MFWNINRLNKIIEKAGCVLGLKLDSVETVTAKNTVQIQVSLGQHQSFSVPCLHTAKEHIQQQTAVPEMLHWQIREVFRPLCYKAVPLYGREGEREQTRNTHCLSDNNTVALY